MGNALAGQALGHGRQIVNSGDLGGLGDRREKPLLLDRLGRTRADETLRAIRTNDIRAASIGIDVRLHKWLAFVISWMLAGLAGGLMVFLKAGTTPMSLHWSESVNVLIMTIFGGLGTIVGPVLGAVCFVFLHDVLTSTLAIWQFVFGLIFVVVVIAFPSGLAGLPAQFGKLRWRFSR